MLPVSKSCNYEIETKSNILKKTFGESTFNLQDQKNHNKFMPKKGKLKIENVDMPYSWYSLVLRIDAPSSHKWFILLTSLKVESVFNIQEMSFWISFWVFSVFCEKRSRKKVVHYIVVFTYVI